MQKYIENIDIRLNNYVSVLKITLESTCIVVEVKIAVHMEWEKINVQWVVAGNDVIPSCGITAGVSQAGGGQLHSGGGDGAPGLPWGCGEGRGGGGVAPCLPH